MRQGEAAVRISGQGTAGMSAREEDTLEANVLLLGTPETDANGLEREITRTHPHMRVLTALDPAGFASALENTPLQLVLLDHHPPRTDAAQTLRMARERHPGMAFVVLSHPEDEYAAGALLEAGASDFLPRSHLERLGPCIARALRENQLQRELERTRQSLQDCTLELERLLRNASLELFLKKEAMEEDLRLARKIHHALLPKHIAPLGSLRISRRPDGKPTPPRAATPHSVRFASLYRPASVQGGDFFHLGRASKTRVNLFIGDVMGHGVRAALVSTMLRALHQTPGPSTPGPERLLQCMNQALCGLAEDLDLPVLATGCALTLDLQSATLRFASAGHPPPVRLPARGNHPVFLGEDGPRHPALGIFPDATFSQHTLSLEEGDKVLLYTDGIFQAENTAGQCLGSEILEGRLRDGIRLPLRPLLDSLSAFLTDYAGGASPADDICMLGLELASPPPRDA